MFFINKRIIAFYNSHRIAKSVRKTLLWIYVKKDLSKIGGKLGIDLAGGSMKTKRFFKQEKYICVDIDKNKLDMGKKKYPDVIVINKKIQDYLLISDNAKPDLLVCLQTFGYNNFFENSQILETIKLMSNYLKPEGSMIFNIGHGFPEIDMIKNKLNSFLNKEFKSVKCINYYSYFDENKMKLGPLVLIFAYVIYFFPLLNKIFRTKSKNIYFCCKNKI